MLCKIQSSGTGSSIAKHYTTCCVQALLRKATFGTKKQKTYKCFIHFGIQDIQRLLKSNVLLKSGMFLLGLMEKQIFKNMELCFYMWHSSKTSVCPEMEELTYSHKGRMDYEINGVGRDSEIDCFD